MFISVLALRGEDQSCNVAGGGIQSRNRGRAHRCRWIDVSGPLWCNTGIQILHRFPETHTVIKFNLIEVLYQEYPPSNRGHNEAVHWSFRHLRGALKRQRDNGEYRLLALLASCGYAVFKPKVTAANLIDIALNHILRQRFILFIVTQRKVRLTIYLVFYMFFTS